MKNIYLTLFIICLSLLASYAQTTGELTVSTTTSEAGGNYAPRNIVAIWIEDDAGNFQKTLLAYAQNRRTHLNMWQSSTADAGSEYNTLDAITGATRSSHSTRSCTWDGTDFNGNLVADGEYFVWMELTDKNSTGNFSSFQFSKGEELAFQMPSNVPSFSSISISWEPDIPTEISEINEIKATISPNPGYGLYTLQCGEFDNLQVRSVSGQLVFSTTDCKIDISNQPNGIYFLVIEKGAQKEILKLIKN